MSDAVISCQGLTQIFDDGDQKLTLFESIDFSLQAGECAALMGASGSGKSTLMHCLAGLMKPTAGQVSLLGHDVATTSDDALAHLRASSLGFVYQFHHLLPEFTAAENVAMPLWLQGEGRHVALDKAKVLLEQFQLGNRAHHKPAALSGGERQRVAIARAMINQPKLVLADEPTGNLDHKTAQSVFDWMLDVFKAHDTAFLMVTHDRALAQKVGRVLMLEGRKIQGA